MTLLHADWLTEPPVFTEDIFCSFIVSEADRLQIPEQLCEQFIYPVFEIPLSPANVRAYAKNYYMQVQKEIMQYEEMYAEPDGGLKLYYAVLELLKIMPAMRLVL